MIKAIPVDGYKLGEPAVSLVRQSSRGLIGHDRSEFLKRASAEFVNQFDNVRLQPGDVAAHQLIIGATEVYGPNRNKDGFRKRACQLFHPTFVKYARCYRNHVNKDPAKSYGYIKLSYYNPKMHRIELLAIYNGTKQAAARNGGLIANEEIEDLEKRGDFPISMACKLPFDHCSHCNNAAKSRDEYCRGFDEGGQCKAGGLFRNIGAITDDPHNPILHADNRDNVVFFDSSRVPRQADMIAYALGIAKTANAAQAQDGVSLAAALRIAAPLEVEIDDDAVLDIVKLGRYVAARELQLGDRVNDLVAGFCLQDGGDWTNPLPWHEKLAALSQLGIVAPLAGFIEIMCGKSAADKEAQARKAVPGAVARLLNDTEMFVDLTASGIFSLPTSSSKEAMAWASSLSGHNLTDIRSFRKRAAAAVLDDRLRQRIVGDSSDPAADRLAKIYAAYKLAFLHRVKNATNFDLVTDLTISQN